MLYVKEAMFRVSENVLFLTSCLSNRKKAAVKSGSLLLRIIMEPSKFMKPTF